VLALRDRAPIGLMVFSFARIYDRRRDEVSLDEVERISI